ncbi:Undecaprenyl-phosphate mannosyltransferase [Poriferisphaera corsica]|uniref:Undecaprenyl-phosphate mannosyltransferase n=1 Tax=Poriferisphaera corsica TaxID=2528020 RepID=A0A517YVD9_9BACT|nr:glycosyltransferase [Poriferisphaera corsica]QDU34179.1 Undecaprenyl-phosphate mannosyltransferase [Poriferisphaera corsica]
MEKISVILPVFNEAGLINAVMNRVIDFVEKHNNYYFIFVDDGSDDATASIIADRLCRAGINERITLLQQPINMGKGEAVKSAILACRTPYVCFTDGDLAYSLDHIIRLRKKLLDFDVVIGSRKLIPFRQRNISLGRKCMGKVFNLIVRAVLGLPYKDTQAGLKGFKRDVALDVFQYQRMSGFAFDAELLFLAKRRGYKIAEIPASVSKSHSYKVSKMNLWLEPLIMLKAILQIRLNSILGKYLHANNAEFRCRRVRYTDRVRAID